MPGTNSGPLQALSPEFVCGPHVSHDSRAWLEDGLDHDDVESFDSRVDLEQSSSERQGFGDPSQGKTATPEALQDGPHLGTDRVQRLGGSLPRDHGIDLDVAGNLRSGVHAPAGELPRVHAEPSNQPEVHETEGKAEDQKIIFADDFWYGFLPAGLHLSARRAPGLGDVTLRWLGGAPTFSVYRSDVAQDLYDPVNLLGQTPGREWVDTPPVGELWFYGILEP